MVTHTWTTKQTDGQSVEDGKEEIKGLAGQEGRKRREEGLWSNRQGTRDRRQGRGCRRQMQRLDGGSGRGAIMRVGIMKVRIKRVRERRPGTGKGDGLCVSLLP